MTLVVALAGRNEVIIGAERLCPLGDSDGQYGISVSKIRPLNDLAFGFAGWRSGFSLFDTAKIRYSINPEISLHEEIKSFLTVMSQGYSAFSNLSDDIRVVACGVDAGEPMIYTTRLFCGGGGYPTHHAEGRVAVGIEKHGALHFLHTYHRPDMTTNELAFLAYFSIAEAIRHDTRVRGPVEIYVVREKQDPKPLEQEQLTALQTAAREAKAKLGDVLVSMTPDIGL